MFVFVPSLTTAAILAPTTLALLSCCNSGGVSSSEVCTASSSQLWDALLCHVAPEAAQASMRSEAAPDAGPGGQETGLQKRCSARKDVDEPGNEFLPALVGSLAFTHGRLEQLLQCISATGEGGGVRGGRGGEGSGGEGGERGGSRSNRGRGTGEEGREGSGRWGREVVRGGGILLARGTDLPHSHPPWPGLA